MSKHPMQPLERDDYGVLHFKMNAIVRFLKDTSQFDLNTLALMPFSQEDWVQFYQLIGYSFSGFVELSCVSEEVYEQAENQRELFEQEESNVQQ